MKLSEMKSIFQSLFVDHKKEMASCFIAFGAHFDDFLFQVYPIEDNPDRLKVIILFRDDNTRYSAEESVHSIWEYMFSEVD